MRLCVRRSVLTGVEQLLENGGAVAGIPNEDQAPQRCLIIWTRCFADRGGQPCHITITIIIIFEFRRINVSHLKFPLAHKAIDLPLNLRFRG